MVAFEQIDLEVGETKTVKFEIGEKELGFYHADRRFYAESGLFEIMVGTNCEQLLRKTVEIDFE